ncbi:putative Integral membrane protein [Seiridium cardinale]|uniref:Integral membrane protein n=1 Tax=Seiridium cardinale TaxID=138064 RepID=A0ABR2Y1N3_9PEZI
MSHPAAALRGGGVFRPPADNRSSVVQLDYMYLNIAQPAGQHTSTPAASRPNLLLFHRLFGGIFDSTDFIVSYATKLERLHDPCGYMTGYLLYEMTRGIPDAEGWQLHNIPKIQFGQYHGTHFEDLRVHLPQQLFEPEHDEKANELVPSYFKTFFPGGAARIFLLYGISISTGAANFQGQPNGAWRWYAAGTALAATHFAFVPKINVDAISTVLG